MKIPISAILFKRITDINWRALSGRERGQYDLRLGTDGEFGEFFANVPATEPTNLGGWTRRVTFQALDGSTPVPPHEIAFRFMGPESQRKDYYFASQKYDLAEAYPLWRAGHTAPLDAEFADIDGSAALVARDVNGQYHARWLVPEEVERLPEDLRTRIQSEGRGVYVVSGSPAPLSPEAQNVRDALMEHHNVLVYGPPGTGKTHLVQEVARSFQVLTIDTTAEHDAIDDASATQTRWATFHQSYSYEDFIVGLRPKPSAEGVGFELEAVPGVLLYLSEWARKPGRRGLLVIDEINRGNVSRIFGELITLLEVDKRLASDGTESPTTISVQLPYVSPTVGVQVDLPGGEKAQVPYPFTLPRDIYILSTMNSVDTSVAPLDAALRRRFTMIQLSPDLIRMKELLDLGLGPLPSIDPALTDRKSVCALALKLLERLNIGIGMFLGPDFQFGHWYLNSLIESTTKDEAIAALCDIWRNAFLPQLLEYFAGRSEQLLAVLQQPSNSPALVVGVPESDWEALGASSVLTAGVSPSDSEIVELLLHIVAASAPAPE